MHIGPGKEGRVKLLYCCCTSWKAVLLRPNQLNFPQSDLYLLENPNKVKVWHSGVEIGYKMELPPPPSLAWSINFDLYQALRLLWLHCQVINKGVTNTKPSIVPIHWDQARSEVSQNFFGTNKSTSFKRRF